MGIDRQTKENKTVSMTFLHITAKQTYTNLATREANK